MTSIISGYIKPYIGNKKVQWLLLLAIILITYGRTIQNDFNLDDHLITGALDGKVSSVSDLPGLFKLTYNKTDYRPIVFLAFGIEQLLFDGIHPSTSHGIQLFLFFLVCIAALKLFELLFGEEHRILCFLAVVVFCVHPANTEVVCSLKCRDNLLSMLFSICSSISFLYFLQKGRWHYVYLVLSISLSVIALLSKMDAIGFLLFNIGYVLFFQRDKKILYIGLGIFLLIIIPNIVTSFTDSMMNKPATEALKAQVTFTENPLGFHFTLINRIIAMINTVGYYFSKLIPVSGFHYYYGYNYLQVLSIGFAFIAGIFLFTGFLIAFIIVLKKNNRIISISIMGIFILSLYALNFIVPVAGIIADRYIFMANLFFCLLFVYVFYLVLSHFLQRPSIYYSSISGVILFFFILSYMRVPAWKDLTTLIDTDAPKLYSSYEAMRIAGAAYYKAYEKETDISIKKSYLEKSIFYTNKGIDVYPKNYLLYLFAGQYYFEAKDYHHAIEYLRTSIQNDSTTADGFIYLGDIYYSLKKSDSALYLYQRGLNINPTSPALINNISTIYYDSDKASCLRFNQQLIQKDSTLYPAYENLGYYYLGEHDTLTAQNYFKKSVTLGLDPAAVPIRIR